MPTNPLVTYNRTPLFTDPANVARLRQALSMVRQERPFEIVAAVVLLDHMHLLWTLPTGDADFSSRVGRLKVLFTRSFQEQQATHRSVSTSRLKHRESDVWQRRFWEHTIRDEQDFQRHLDYIHYNPVKHRLTNCPHLWEHSSFGRWVKCGAYAEDWCCVCSGRQAKAPDFTDIDKVVGE